MSHIPKVQGSIMTPLGILIIKRLSVLVEK